MTMSIEEIENGFITRKSYDVQYQIGEKVDYAYFTQKWYTKKNPMKLDIPKEKSLADKLD